jgi:methylase of polypeptide subunit release factors
VPELSGRPDARVRLPSLLQQLAAPWRQQKAVRTWLLHLPCCCALTAAVHAKRACLGHTALEPSLTTQHLQRPPPALACPQILDVASASGEPAVSLARALPQAAVVASDFAEPFLQLGRCAAAASAQNCCLCTTAE